MYTPTIRRLLLATALTLACLRAPAQQSDFPPPLHPATVEQVKQIMKLSHAAESMKAQLNASIAQQRKTGHQILPTAFWDDFATQFEQTDLTSLLVPIYQRYYSTDDAAEIIRFYSTPAGQKLVAASQPFYAELLRTGQELGRKIGGELGTKYAAEIEANMKRENSPAPQP